MRREFQARLMSALLCGNGLLLCCQPFGTLGRHHCVATLDIEVVLVCRARIGTYALQQ
jgi:hypothetical protein